MQAFYQNKIGAFSATASNAHCCRMFPAGTAYLKSRQGPVKDFYFVDDTVEITSTTY